MEFKDTADFHNNNNNNNPRSQSPQVGSQLKRERDAAIERANQFEKQVKQLQSANRELAQRRIFEEEAFRAAIKNERIKAEKMITSLSAKLRDRNNVLVEWVHYTLDHYDSDEEDDDEYPPDYTTEVIQTDNGEEIVVTNVGYMGKSAFLLILT